jgi:hypothetical protein
MAVRFCGASAACCPAAARTISKTWSSGFDPRSVEFEAKEAEALSLVGAGLTFTLACPSSVSISAPLNVSLLEDSNAPEVLELSIVVENVLPPTIAVSSVVPLTLLPTSVVKTATPTEVYQLGAGTYRAYVTGKPDAVPTLVFSVDVSGEINILAVVKQL